MDRKSGLLLDTVTTIFLAVALLLLIINNPEGSVWLFGSAVLFLFLSILRLFIWNIPLDSKRGLLFIGIQFGLGFLMNTMDNSFVSQIFLFVLLGEAAFVHSAAFSLSFSLACVLSFGLSRWIYQGFPPFSEIAYIIPRSLEYFAIALLSHFAKRMLEQRQQLALANERLQQAARKLEENILLQERTRVSRELHDTVGHTLTTALIGLRAGLFTLQRDQEGAQKILRTVEDHLEKGLMEARKAVHLFAERQTFLQFIPSLQALLNETSKQTGIVIHSAISPDLPQLDPKLEMILYRALQEGLTNGIRHGKCASVQFSLARVEDAIVFQLQDDGQGVKGPLVFGFGLRTMRDRVTEAGGVLIVETAPAGGMVLHISIPTTTAKEVNYA
ncbi:sensor histidine kinase [Brevibacillus ruminantium]|uniref:histidine kinase n=1 Tax=Brevibacillus ruminantium TaxID=2950604 RepID=A0ABY4WIG0_9BACL|nr:sensor histidine kinase [Brevibacillus ruminantium]USG66936.1 sensor histidine kinase [Brevibacillus ruminantium]